MSVSEPQRFENHLIHIQTDILVHIKLIHRILSKLTGPETYKMNQLLVPENDKNMSVFKPQKILMHLSDL